MMGTAEPSILVVDDDVDTCSNLADIFGDLGYRVATALDGESALGLLRRQRYDVALLDLMMPGMDGAALSEEIKKVRAGTVALIVTAHPGNPRADVALARGAWRLLSKPIDFPRLMGLIEQALGQPLLLVVDDDPDVCANLWDLLREQGYRVCVAHDVAGAVELVRDDRYRVLLLDMRLPDGDGGQVFRAARQANPEARAVVITGCCPEFEGQVRQILDEGAREVLFKPFDVPTLLATVERLAAQASGA
jgi:two-component system, NtrC family, response regulator HydG